MENYQEDLFKIRRVIIEYKNGDSDEAIGFLAPSYSYFNGGILEGRYDLISVESGLVTLDLDYIKTLTFKTVKGLRSEVKEVLMVLVKKHKNIYKTACQILTLKEQTKPIQKEVNQLSQELPLLSGLLTKEEFLEGLSVSLGTSFKDFYFSGVMRFGKLSCLSLVKEVELGKYVRDGEFSFAYEEYDGNLMLRDSYEKDPQYRSLIQKHFKLFSKDKVGTWAIRESVYADAGDKRSLSIYHEVELTPKKPLPLTKESIAALTPILTQL